MNPPYSRDALNSRLAERWTVHYKVQFAYPDYAGEGVTLDLSAAGLCIITHREIPPGVELYARLMLPDNSCLDVQTATVKWCDHGQVGLEISEMERPDTLRLLEVLSRLGGSAITYTKKYNSGAVTIGSGRDLGRYIAEILEGSQLRDVLAPAVTQPVKSLYRRKFGRLTTFGL